MSRVSQSVNTAGKFLSTNLTRNRLANAGFLGGIVIAALGAEIVGRSFEISGAGLLLGGVALIWYAYLLGQE